jgi:hypothetical protein
MRNAVFVLSASHAQSCFVCDAILGAVKDYGIRVFVHNIQISYVCLLSLCSARRVVFLSLREPSKAEYEQHRRDAAALCTRVQVLQSARELRIAVVSLSCGIKAAAAAFIENKYNILLSSQITRSRVQSFRQLLSSTEVGIRISHYHRKSRSQQH